MDRGKTGAVCVTCRRRARKCDRTFPSCQACHARGILCEGYLWRWAVATPSDLIPTQSTKPTLAQAQIWSEQNVQPGAPDAAEGSLIKPSSHQASSGMTANGTYRESIDSTAALALLSDSTGAYAIDPSSIPDGLGHLVNYGRVSSSYPRTVLIMDQRNSRSRTSVLPRRRAIQEPL
jgi:hypothetical protein